MKALSEYDKLIRTIHILKFIDNTEYRKEIVISFSELEAINPMNIPVKARDNKNITDPVE